MITGDQNLGQAVRELDQFTAETSMALTGAGDTTHDAVPAKSLTGPARRLGDAAGADLQRPGLHTPLSGGTGQPTEMPATPRE